MAALGIIGIIVGVAVLIYGAYKGISTIILAPLCALLIALFNGMNLLTTFTDTMSQISYIVMQYIDASMVGSLGAEASASIGLVSTSTWLFWGVCVASATGFSVQVAHHIGAKEFGQARAVLRQSFCCDYDIQLAADCNWCTG